MDGAEERLPPPMAASAADAAATGSNGGEPGAGVAAGTRGSSAASSRGAGAGTGVARSGKMWDDAANEMLMQLYVDNGLHALPMNKRGSGPLGTKKQRWRAVTEGMEEWCVGG